MTGPAFPLRLTAIGAVLSATLLAGCNSPADAPDEDTASTEAPAEPAPAPTDADAFLAERFAEDGPIKAVTAHVDLDGDGADEIIAFVFGPMICGTGGCNALVLQADAGGGFTVKMDSSVTQLPIGVLDTTSNGWRDLALGVRGGGAPSGAAAMHYDGSAYPSNPSVEPGAPEMGDILIGEDGYDKAREIVPAPAG